MIDAAQSHRIYHFANNPNGPKRLLCAKHITYSTLYTIFNQRAALINLRANNVPCAKGSGQKKTNKQKLHPKPHTKVTSNEIDYCTLNGRRRAAFIAAA